MIPGVLCGVFSGGRIDNEVNENQNFSPDMWRWFKTEHTESHWTDEK